MSKILFLLMFAGVFFAGCSDDDENAGPVTPGGQDTIVSPELPVIPDSAKVNISGSNLYYEEVQLGAPQLYWVRFENARHYSNDSCVKWYVNGIQIGKGSQIEYTPAVAGNYSVKYVIARNYSTSDKEVSNEINIKAFSSRGILIQNEPNMTGTETSRGINSYLYGTDDVNRFVVGDYNKVGTTNQFIANWAGKIYNIASYTQQGVAFSQFEENGTFVKALPKMPANVMGRAFAGIDKETGVVTTASNAYLVNLKDFTINENPLKGSDKAANVFVTDGYVFLIANGKALAYNVDSLSGNADSIVLGKATAGFVQSKDGAVWAANGKEFLRINPKDLATEIIPIPDGVQLKFSSSPWKQCSFIASAKENALFFTNDGGWGTASAIYKYDIDEKALNKEFVTKDKFDNYMLYATCLLYDAEQDLVVCSAMKGYGSDSAYNGLFFFDAKTGEKRSRALYSTDPTTKDMWFPAMMVPVKN